MEWSVSSRNLSFMRYGSMHVEIDDNVNRKCVIRDEALQNIKKESSIAGKSVLAEIFPNFSPRTKAQYFTKWNLNRR